jgi:hypothetical protein
MEPRRGEWSWGGGADLTGWTEDVAKRDLSCPRHGSTTAEPRGNC